jgi:hypothetical protein
VVPETKPTLTALPEEGVRETPVTVALNVRMERFDKGEGGIARSASERVALAEPPPPLPVFGRPLHAHMEKINEEDSKPYRILFIVDRRGQPSKRRLVNARNVSLLQSVVFSFA